METAAWMVGREGGVVELRFDAPEPPFEIVKELVFRDDAEQIAQAYSASLTRKLELMSELSALKAESVRRARCMLDLHGIINEKDIEIAKLRHRRPVRHCINSPLECPTCDKNCDAKDAA